MPKLGSSAHQHKFRIGNERTKVGHGADAKEYEWRIPSLHHTLIQNVEDRSFLIHTNLVAWLKWNVAYQDAEANGHKQHWLEVMLDGEVNKQQAEANHDQVGIVTVVETCEMPELSQIA
jgi:hypothetical protein